MKTLYFDCFCGISGDMTLGALLDLGIDLNKFYTELSKLGIDDEFSLTITPMQKSGIRCLKVDVHLTQKTHNHHGRGLDEIYRLIDNSKLNDRVKKISKDIFLNIAIAEGKIHNKEINEVHFHEVGATDSIVDIVGCAICIDIINPNLILSSSLNEGTGQINCTHGIMPVPAPATLELLKMGNVPFNITNEVGEMITPTGAAIIVTLAKGFTLPKDLAIDNIGYGCGTREFKRANILRAILYKTQENNDRVYVIETNIDDCTPENISFVCDMLFSAGALDVYTTQIYMKKNRQAVCLSVIVRGDTTPFEAIIFTHSSTIGVRKYEVERTVLQRENVIANTKYGDISVKVSIYENIKKYYPEYEDVAKICKLSGIPYETVYNTAIQTIKE